MVFRQRMYREHCTGLLPFERDFQRPDLLVGPFSYALLCRNLMMLTHESHRDCGRWRHLVNDRTAHWPNDCEPPHDAADLSKGDQVAD